MKRRQLVVSLLIACACALAGCGPVRLVANANIPPPLIVKIPMGVALFMPKEFGQYVHEEERWSTKWQIELGKAQTEGMTRLFTAMFERVVPVDSVNAGAQTPGVAAILEPSIEEYAFVTPRDAGSSFYAVSVKYRVNVYMPDGKLADSWGFTGYGSAPAQGLSSAPPLAAATALAMRDAGAKLAVEFREQAIVRGLLPAEPGADDRPAASPQVESETESAAEPAAESAGESAGESQREPQGIESSDDGASEEAAEPMEGRDEQVGQPIEQTIEETEETEQTPAGRSGESDQD